MPETNRKLEKFPYHCLLSLYCKVLHLETALHPIDRYRLQWSSTVTKEWEETCWRLGNTHNADGIGFLLVGFLNIDNV